MQIQQIWLEVLSLDRVSIHASFFQIGGSSLLAVMVSSRIRAAFQVQIPASQLFTDKTIAHLSDTVSRLQSGGPQGDEAGGPQRPATPPQRLSAQDLAQGVYCTLNQEVMILSHQLSPKPMAFSMPFAVRLRGALDVPLLEQSLQLAISRQKVLLCHLQGQLISKGFAGKALRGLVKGSMAHGKLVEGVLRNSLVSKMVQKRMQGKAGLGTKMVLPLKTQQASRLFVPSGCLNLPARWGKQ